MDCKRIFALLLITCLIVSMATSAFAVSDEKVDDDIVYSIDSDTHLITGPGVVQGTTPDRGTISTQEIVNNPLLEEIDFTQPANIDNNGCITIPDAGILVDLIIPSEINGHAVTNLTANAFRGMSYFNTVRIPASITKIGADAFADCDGLKYIILQDRTSSDDMTLGQNWSGNAQVVFEKILKETVVISPEGEKTPSDDSIYSVDDDVTIIPMPDSGTSGPNKPGSDSSDSIYSVDDDVTVIPIPDAGLIDPDDDGTAPGHDSIYSIREDITLI